MTKQFMIKVTVLPLLVVLTKGAHVANERSGNDLAYLAEAGNEFEGDIITDGEFRNIVAETQIWPNGIVPYVIGSEFDGTTNKDTILSAMKYIEDRSCVRFVPRTNQAGYAMINSLSGCKSKIGYRVSMRQMSFEISKCWRQGTLVHEFLHLLGFFHEQARPDRDDYVNIYLDNVGDGKEYNFDKQQFSRTLETNYDYGSIMHYGEYSFSKSPNVLKTIEAKNGAQIGQRNGMSATDIKKLNTLYGCSTDTNTGGTTTDCRDDKLSCGYWSGKGYCSTQVEFMRTNCPKTCNMC